MSSSAASDERAVVSTLPVASWVPEGWSWRPYIFAGQEWERAERPDRLGGVCEAEAWRVVGDDSLRVQVRTPAGSKAELVTDADQGAVLAAVARMEAFLAGHAVEAGGVTALRRALKDLERVVGSLRVVP